MYASIATIQSTPETESCLRCDLAGHRRLMRTRMSGGVGGGGRNPSADPISHRLHRPNTLWKNVGFTKLSNAIAGLSS